MQRLVESLVSQYGSLHCKSRVLLSLLKYLRIVWGFYAAIGQVVGDAGSGPGGVDDLEAAALVASELPEDGADYVPAAPHTRLRARASCEEFIPIDLDYVLDLHDPSAWPENMKARVKVFADMLEAGLLAGEVGKYVLATDTAVSNAFDNPWEATEAAYHCGIRGACIMRVGRHHPSELHHF